ncbi:MAG: polysaccharide deacetylase family protein [Actinobacteria bacterium]|nr:polysaccharide deacetylase family protein [Actinomycetota bacterium]MBU1944426.1 polysaccharide deacetylase family protein [Actinomycetota bacterium]MBU2688212.1 polysaccharide deacetylase family protein [Actinomycetota bacterium]
MRVARILFALLAASSVALAGCGGARTTGAVDVNKLLEQKIKPNEMGMVMIIEYHRVEDEESDYTRSIENFKKDMATFYEKGYRLIAFHDLLKGRIDVPAGTTPMVFSFDDSTQCQFNYVKKGDKTVIDPNCALGLMQAFYDQHKDFGYTAQFNLLPQMFDQEDYKKKKLDYLQTNGFEFGNHTVSHPSLGRQSDEAVQEEIATMAKDIKSVEPKATVDVLCLPNGSVPKNQALMYDGSFEGYKYHNNWALLVGSNPFYPVWHYRNPGTLVPRIQAMDYDPEDGSGAEGSVYWLRYFDRHPELRFVSDGDPTTICAPSYMEPRLTGDNIPSGVQFVGY